MRLILIGFIFQCLITNISAQENITSFILNIDGKEYEVKEGETLKLDGEFSQPEISISASKTSELITEAISFKYPSNFSYEFEEEFAYKNWTLNGNDFVIMYFEIGARTELDDFINEMVDQFGKKNCKIRKTKMEFGGRALNGKRMDIKIVGQALTMDFFEIEISDEVSRFLVLQDTLNEEDKASEEAGRTMKMIKATMSFNLDKT